MYILTSPTVEEKNIGRLNKIVTDSFLWATDNSSYNDDRYMEYSNKLIIRHLGYIGKSDTIFLQNVKYIHTSHNAIFKRYQHTVLLILPWFQLSFLFPFNYDRIESVRRNTQLIHKCYIAWQMSR